jgi:hypothetical protein
MSTITLRDVDRIRDKYHADDEVTRDIRFLCHELKNQMQKVHLFRELIARLEQQVAELSRGKGDAT